MNRSHRNGFTATYGGDVNYAAEEDISNSSKVAFVPTRRNEESLRSPLSPGRSWLLSALPIIIVSTLSPTLASNSNLLIRDRSPRLLASKFTYRISRFWIFFAVSFDSKRKKMEEHNKFLRNARNVGSYYKRERKEEWWRTKQKKIRKARIINRSREETERTFNFLFAP